MSNNGYSMRPLAVWEDATHFKVGPVCDPQEKGRPIALVPKSVGPEAEAYAKLIKQVLYKWKNDCKQCMNPNLKGLHTCSKENKNTAGL